MTICWQAFTLGDLCNMKYGKMPKKEDLVETGYPVFTGYRIVGYHKEFLYEQPEIVVVARGVGGCGDIKISPPYCYLTNLSIVLQIAKPEIVDKKFLFYRLFSTSLSSLNTGAAQPQIIIADLQTYEVRLPSLETQRKIASILSAYDDLIENNTRRIKILEEMAQMIYREWFVKFRFPGHERVKMVDSAMGRIPEGWEVAKVGELLEKTPRKKKIQKQDYIEQGEFPVVDQGKEFIGGYTSDIEAVIEKPLPLIVFGDHTRILKYIDFPFACGADGTQLLKANTSRMPISLFYYAILAVDLSNFAYARHFKFLKEEQLIVPDQEMASMFEKHVSKMHDHISCLTKKNHNLRQTRDLLLPRLISGEVSI